MGEANEPSKTCKSEANKASGPDGKEWGLVALRAVCLAPAPFNVHGFYRSASITAAILGHLPAAIEHFCTSLSPHRDRKMAALLSLLTCSE